MDFEQKAEALCERINRIASKQKGTALFEALLTAIIEATDTDYAMLGYLADDGALVCPSLTETVWQACEMTGTIRRLPHNQRSGLWGRALDEKRIVYKNRFGTVPWGHLSIVRSLAAPLLVDGETIGLLMLANSPDDYNDADAAFAAKVSQALAPVVYRERQRFQKRCQG